MVRILLKLVYWLAVLAISIVLVLLLVRFFESRDRSEVDRGALATPAGARA